HARPSRRQARGRPPPCSRCGRRSPSRRPAWTCDPACTRPPHTSRGRAERPPRTGSGRCRRCRWSRSEEHTSELQSRFDLVCRLLLEKKKKTLDKMRFHLTKKGISI